MSYDLHAFPLPPGGDPEAAREAIEVDADSPATPEQAEWMERLAVALGAAAPSLEASRFEDAIELSDDQDRLQASIYPNEAAISIPYWFDGREARDVLALALRCAAVMREAGGLAVWDPQLDRLLGERSTVDELAEGYTAGRNIAIVEDC